MSFASVLVIFSFSMKHMKTKNILMKTTILVLKKTIDFILFTSGIALFSLKLRQIQTTSKSTENKRENMKYFILLFLSCLYVVDNTTKMKQYISMLRKSLFVIKLKKVILRQTTKANFMTFMKLSFFSSEIFESEFNYKF